MASFVPNFQKKIRIRKEKEDKLRRLIVSGVNEAKLLLAAAVVKDARLREMRAKRSQIHPADTNDRDEKIAKIDARIQNIQATTIESILAEFTPD